MAQMRTAVRITPLLEKCIAGGTSPRQSATGSVPDRNAHGDETRQRAAMLRMAQMRTAVRITPLLAKCTAGGTSPRQSATVDARS